MSRSIVTVTCVAVDFEETAGLMYSSRPRRRCAFCIRVLGKLCRAAVGVNQSERLRKAFAIAQYRDTAVVGLFDVVGPLTGLPASNMPHVVLPENTIEQSTAAQNSRMTVVQRS